MLSYGFRLDNVTDFFNITHYSSKFGKFAIYPDPQFTPFPGQMVKAYQSSKNDYLIIDVSTVHVFILKDVILLCLHELYTVV